MWGLSLCLWHFITVALGNSHSTWSRLGLPRPASSYSGLTGLSGLSLHIGTTGWVGIFKHEWKIRGLLNTCGYEWGRIQRKENEKTVRRRLLCSERREWTWVTKENRKILVFLAPILSWASLVLMDTFTQYIQCWKHEALWGVTASVWMPV